MQLAPRIALWLLVLAPALAAAEEPTGALVVKGYTFEPRLAVGGKRFVLLGAGVRKKLIADVYAMGLYVEEERARHAFPALAAKAKGRDQAKLLADGRAESFFLWGSFIKHAVLHFVVDVPADQVRAGFEEGLEPMLSEKALPELRERARAFVALFDRDMKEGEQIVLRTLPSGAIEVTLAGVKKEAPTDARLARAIWETWLAARPASSDLRRALVEHIDVLGR